MLLIIYDSHTAFHEVYLAIAQNPRLLLPRLPSFFFLPLMICTVSSSSVISKFSEQVVRIGSKKKNWAGVLYKK